MSAPHLLCVDDSEAILEFERIALGAHYALSAARDGVEALAKVRQVRPDCVLLDLSMPQMHGDEVLAHMRADPALRDIPVIVITSEAARAEACLRAGASAYLAKPLQADRLLATVEQVFAERRARERVASLAAVIVSVGAARFALPLAQLERVLLEPLTTPLPGGPPYLRELIELHGEPVCVLDLALLLGLDHAAALLDRKLVVLRCGDLRLAARVDAVLDPQEYTAAQLTARERLAGGRHAPLDRALIGVLSTASGPVPAIDPCAFVEPEQVDDVVRLAKGVVPCA